jgi:hypothetical protein
MWPKMIVLYTYDDVRACKIVDHDRIELKYFEIDADQKSIFASRSADVHARI